MSQSLRLVSHHLCPYVQRAVIALTEKGVAHERSYIDLADRPAWFREMSPLGKVPLLLVDGATVLFESAVICEYLEETAPSVALHPADPLTRARHRAWIEFASATLNDIWGLYTAPDAAAFDKKRGELAAKFQRLEEALGEGAYFAGENFSLVDAAFAPVFRYFDVFERYVALNVFAATPKVRAWRAALAGRPSVRDAVSPDYGDRLAAFLLARQSHLSRLMAVVQVRNGHGAPEGDERGAPLFADPADRAAVLGTR